MLEGYLYEPVSRSDGSATVRLLPQSPLFDAHFPGYPVTPGVTLVQMATELIGRRLAGAKDIKFRVPVLPSADGPVLRFDWQLREDSEADVKVYLPDGTLSAKMMLSLL